MPTRHFGAIRKLPSGRWQARYRSPDGVMRPAPGTFERKGDASRWLAGIETDIAKGEWRDPHRAQQLVTEYATGNAFAAKVPGTTIRDLMGRMGHDSTRAAMIYLHGAPGADRIIADAFPCRFRPARGGMITLCRPEESRVGRAASYSGDGSSPSLQWVSCASSLQPCSQDSRRPELLTSQGSSWRSWAWP